MLLGLFHFFSETRAGLTVKNQNSVLCWLVYFIVIWKWQHQYLLQLNQHRYRIIASNLDGFNWVDDSTLFLRKFIHFIILFVKGYPADLVLFMFLLFSIFLNKWTQEGYSIFVIFKFPQYLHLNTLSEAYSLKLSLLIFYIVYVYFQDWVIKGGPHQTGVRIYILEISVYKFSFDRYLFIMELLYKSFLLVYKVLVIVVNHSDERLVRTALVIELTSKTSNAYRIGFRERINLKFVTP